MSIPIEAAHAWSDIYGMWGKPRIVLSIVGFATKAVNLSPYSVISRKGLEKLNEAGVTLLGGHSVSGRTNTREFSGPHIRMAVPSSASSPQTAGINTVEVASTRKVFADLLTVS